MKKCYLISILPLLLVSCGKHFDFSVYEWTPITEVFDRAVLQYLPAPATPMSEEEFQSYSDEKFNFRERERNLHIIRFYIDDKPKVKIIAFKFYYVCPVLAQSHQGEDWLFSMALIQFGGMGYDTDLGFDLTEENAVGNYEYYYQDFYVAEDFQPEGIEGEVEKK